MPPIGQTQKGANIYAAHAGIGSHLKKDGALLLEIGLLPGPAVKKLLEDSDAFGPIKIEKDFNRNDRVVTAVRK